MIKKLFIALQHYLHQIYHNMINLNLYNFKADIHLKLHNNSLPSVQILFGQNLPVLKCVYNNALMIWILWQLMLKLVNAHIYHLKNAKTACIQNHINLIQNVNIIQVHQIVQYLIINILVIQNTFQKKTINYAQVVHKMVKKLMEIHA